MLDWAGVTQSASDETRRDAAVTAGRSIHPDRVRRFPDAAMHPTYGRRTYQRSIDLMPLSVRGVYRAGLRIARVIDGSCISTSIK